MDSPLGDGRPVRRSNRLKKIGPEYNGLESLQQTPEKHVTPTRRQDLKSKIQMRSRSPSPDILEGGLKTNGKSSHSFSQILEPPYWKVDSEIRYEAAVEEKRSYKSNASFSPSTNSNSPALSSCAKLLIGGLLILVVVAFTFYTYETKDSSMDLDLTRMFPHQSKELWGFVSHGMMSENPFVLLLVHNGQDDLAKCLAERIATKVSFARTKHLVKPTIVDGTYVKSDLLVMLRAQMEKTHALVLQRLEHLPEDVALHLHFVLDVHEPWVPHAVYVLTLQVPDVNESIGAKETSSAVQSFLKYKWSKIEEDHLNPLITRICNYEYVIRKDDNPCK